MYKRIVYTLLIALTALPTPHATSAAPTPQNTQPRLIDSLSRDRNAQHWVDSLMHRLTLKEKVAQLFIYTIAPQQSKRNIALLQQAVENHHVGGLLFSGGELENQAQLTNTAQRMARVPLMITFDGEWGPAMRLRNTTAYPRNMVLGCIDDDELIRDYGRAVAQQCRQMGVQVNFAPVADVNINPNNPVINTRSFGEDPQRVAQKVIAYATGLEQGGVLAVCKHFPGHGDTDVDSHKALPLLPFDRQRLDSIELLPFRQAIDAGLGAIMVGHLQVPAIDPTPALPASLSEKVVTQLLAGELRFGGLIITDALAMKGVAHHPNPSLKALRAGNDMVLAPRNIGPEIDAVMKAIRNGELTAAEVERKCRKVLAYKYALGLSRRPIVNLSGLRHRIDTPETDSLIARLNCAAVTLLTNHEQILPLLPHAYPVALVETGDTATLAPLAHALSRHARITRFRLPEGEMDARQEAVLRDSLARYRRIVVALAPNRPTAPHPFLGRLPAEVPTVVALFAPAATLPPLQPALEGAQAIVLAHTPAAEVQRHVADLLFGAATANARLAASAGPHFRAGQGVTLTPQSPRRYIAADHGLRADVLLRIDTIARQAIAEGAMPGCQVVVMKDGYPVVERCYGTLGGPGTAAVAPTTLYDLASLTKTTATVLALMRLYDKGRFALTDPVAHYLPFLADTDKRHITIRQLLLHQSGLPAGIALRPEADDPRPAAERAQALIARTRITRSTYRYSDTGFVLLGLLVEQLAGMPMDRFLHHELFEPMGLRRTTFVPLRSHPLGEIAPSAARSAVSPGTVQGTVHDETAATLGGIAGHAGLFSTATEVARLHQLLLQGGTIDGQRLLGAETCRLFTTERSSMSRRGLGFDRPATPHTPSSPCAPSAPATVYGHTGFTGTCAWVDPENAIVYVFLSNRTYPEADNKKLQRSNVRERIQQTLYDAMMP